MVKQDSQSNKENVPSTTATAKQSKKGTKDRKSNGEGKKAIWTSADDEALIEQLKVERDAGNQADSGWKGPVWTRCAAKLNEIRIEGVEKTPTGCRDHWGIVSFPFGLRNSCMSKQLL